MVDSAIFAITGCGIVSAAGSGFALASHAVSGGKSTVQELGSGRKGAVVEELDVDSFIYQKKASKVLDRRGRHALVAAQEAVQQSGLNCSELSLRRGVSLAVGFSSPGDEMLNDVFSSGSSGSLVQHLQGELPPLWLLGRLPNIPASHLSIQYKGQGPVLTSCQGGQALTDAMDCIQNGEGDVFLAGASEAWFSPTGLAVLDQNQEQGKIQGEASVIFVVESLEHASARRARILKKMTRGDLARHADDSETVEALLGDCGCAAELLALALSLGTEQTGD